MNTKTITNAGIEYSLPIVTLMKETGIGTAEYAARTCYDSFESSENACIVEYNDVINCEKHSRFPGMLTEINSIEHSNLLDTLAWTHFHYSILEHINLTYLIRGTSRSVLVEHSRHRIQAISVRSTRYTMGGVVNAFVASQYGSHPRKDFVELVRTLDMFVVKGTAETLEIEQLHAKFKHQYDLLGAGPFLKLVLSKSALADTIWLSEMNDPHSIFTALQNAKSKRNVGDALKWVVTDNWKVDMVVTFNLRSLKNYFSLRDSGAAFFLIRELAKAMKNVTSSKYLDLIVKDK